ncbi:hypothetical protein D9M71_369040 [compost metagenome]
MTEGQGLAGLDSQLPEGQFARFAQGQAQVIGLTHGNTTGREDQIDLTQPRQAITGFFQVVGKNPRIDHLATQALQPTDQQASITVVDLPWPQRQARFYQLVARGQHGNLDPAHYPKRGATQRCRQPKLDRPQPCTRRQHRLADTGFLTLRAHILADAQRLVEAHPLVLQDLGVLLHLDTVGTQRQRRAGEDPCTGARL